MSPARKCHKILQTENNNIAKLCVHREKLIYLAVRSAHVHGNARPEDDEVSIWRNHWQPNYTTNRTDVVKLWESVISDRPRPTYAKSMTKSWHHNDKTRYPVFEHFFLKDQTQLSSQYQTRLPFTILILFFAQYFFNLKYSSFSIKQLKVIWSKNIGQSAAYLVQESNTKFA